MKPSPGSGLLVGVIIVGLLIASPSYVTPAAAKAPPEPVCGVCTNALEDAAREHGVTLDRGESTMTVRLSENGSATFVAHVELTTGADRLRNDTLREAIVRDVSYVLVENRRQLRTAVTNTTLIVRYRSDDVAHTTAGVVRFDGFQTRDPPPLASGGEGSPYPGADRLTLRAPTGFRVYGTHGDSNNETAIVWKGNSHRQFAGHIEEDVVISFVPRDARFPALRVTITAIFDWFGTLVS
ncbi:MAG: hypothetical protein ABEJ58_08810 [Halodesulfurarchaeum sp.]